MLSNSMDVMMKSNNENSDRLRNLKLDDDEAKVSYSVDDKRINMNVPVDKEKNQVVCCEEDSDFVVVSFPQHASEQSDTSSTDRDVEVMIQSNSMDENSSDMEVTMPSKALVDKPVIENRDEEVKVAMQSDLLEEKRINLNLLVDKEKNQVVWCEMDSDVMDLLLSFLLLPMGTVIRLSEKESEIGCMDILYQSVENISPSDFITKACQTMLLKPRREICAECKCQNLVHRIDHEPRESYCCSPCQVKFKPPFALLSMFPDTKCTCGREMIRIPSFLSSSIRGGFVEKGRWFMSDNLMVLTESAAKSLQQLSKSAEIRKIVVGIDKLLNLLKRAFLSKTPMTDMFLRHEDPMETFERLDQSKTTQSKTPLYRPMSSDPSRSFSLELAISKSKNKVVFAIADAFFVDFLFSFLTFPVGSITKLLDGCSSMGSIDHLYKSIQFLSDNNMLDEYCKKILLNPRISFMWGIQKQLLQVEEATFDIKSLKLPRGTSKRTLYKNPKRSYPTVQTGGGYVIQDLQYLLTDDLEIKPCSRLDMFCHSIDMPISGLKEEGSHPLDTCIFGMRMNELDSKVVSVGEREALAILQAAMTSRKVLTKVFCQRPNKRKRSDQSFACMENISKSIDYNSEMKVSMNSMDGDCDMKDRILRASTEDNMLEEVKANVLSNSVEDKLINGISHVEVEVGCPSELVDEKKFSLNLMVDKEKNKVIWCETDSDFVNALLSFLVLPVGTIIRLTEKRSEIGCMDTLYRSVESLSEDYFITKIGKTMLLNPKKELLAELKLLNHPCRIEVDAVEYYVCPRCSTRKTELYISVVSGTNCYCGMIMERYTDMKPVSSPGEFVKGMTRFVINDNLKVTTVSAVNWSQLNNGSEAIEKRIVTVDRDRLLQLLNRSLLSRTPLMDVLLRNEDLMETFEQLDQEKKTTQYRPPLDQLKNLNLKLFIRKSKNKVVYALANADFVDLLFSFLTFPLGSIVKLFGGNSSIGSVDNLYKSVQHFSTENSKILEEHCMDLLLNPKVSFPSAIKSQLLQVDKEAADVTPENGPIKNFMYTRREAETGRGYVKDAFTYMVTDDLVVKPRCSVSVICHLGKRGRLTDDDIYHCGIPESDLKEEIVSVGECEALAILRAAMTTRKALTKVFCDRSGKKKRGPSILR